MFVELTHTNSGDRVFLKASAVTEIREKNGKTLVICEGKGMYVNETADFVRAIVEQIAR